MKCSEFLDRFSEFYDEDPELQDRADFEAHLEGCGSCRRYMEVVERGSHLFRNLPFPELRDDFFPRLQHRLFHIDEEDPFRRDTAGSAMTAGTAVAVAALLVLVAWYPTLQSGTPDVELPAIVVEAPAETQSNSLPSAPEPRFTAPPNFSETRLWSHSNVLLYEHSSLGQRHRVIRTGLQ